MGPTDVVVPNAPTSPRPPETSPSSPALFSCNRVLTMKHVQQLLGLLKAAQANQTPPTAGEANQPVSNKNKSADEQQVAARASKLEFKTVSEIWDEKAYDYKDTESSNPADGMKDLDQYVFGVEENDDIRLTRLHAAAAADISATSSIQITKSGARSTPSRKKKAKASKAGPTSGMRSKVQAALADQASLPGIDKKSFHDVYRASNCAGGQFEVPNAPNNSAGAFTFRSSSEATASTEYTPGHAPACTTSKSPQIIKFLRWNATPFTLEWIGDDLYCPRLIVDPETALSRILRPASYPLDIAVTLIHEYGGSGKSLPCEASRVLTVYDELHRLDFSDANITLLDPKLFDSSDRSLTEKKAFHKQLGGWIDFIGQGIEIPDVYVGKWHLETVQVDYTQLRMSLCLSKGFYRSVFPLPSGFSDPPRRQLPLQQYRDSRLDLPTLPLRNLSRGMLEDIIFCQYWMNKECNSEDICTVIVRRNNEYHLKPHHIDLVGCQIFQKSLYDEGSGLIRYVSDLSEEKLRQSKARFWKDFELAQRADPFMKW